MVRYRLLVFAFLLSGYSLSGTFNIPHIAEDVWLTQVTIYNMSEDEQVFALRKWDEDGKLTHDVEFTIDTGTIKELTNAFFRSYGIAQVVTENSNSLRVKLSYRYMDSESLCEFFIPEDRQGTYWMMPNPYQPHFEWFGLAVANFNEVLVTVTLSAYKDGDIIDEVQTDIEPFSKLVAISENIWAGLEYEDIDRVEILSDVPLSPPLSITGNGDQSRHLFFIAQPIVDNVNAHNTFYVPHIAESNWQTVITVYNTDSTEAQGTLSSWNSDGSIDIDTMPFSVSENGISVFRAGTDFNYEGIAAVSTEDNLNVKLSYQYGDSESICDFFLQSTLGTQWMIPNSLKSWFDWFGVAVANFNEDSVNLTFKAYKEGLLLSEITKQLDSRFKYVDLIGNIFNEPDNSLEYSDVDTVIIESDLAIPSPLSITGNDFQDRHVFFLSENLNPFSGKYELRVDMDSGVNGHPMEGVYEYTVGESTDYDYSLKSGYKNLQVYVNGETVDSTGIVVVNRHTTLSVTCDPKIVYEIYAASGQHGTISPSGTVQVFEGNGMSYTVSPDDGYQIANVLIDGLSVGAVTNYIFENVNDNHTIYAEFCEAPLYIPDAHFKAFLVSHYDTNNDGEIFISEAEAVTGIIDTPGYYEHSNPDAEIAGDIEDLTGIEYFTRITGLYCENELLDALDISNNPLLKELKCGFNLLTSLDISSNTDLEFLDCSWNRLSDLDIRNNSALRTLLLAWNDLTILDISQNSLLEELWCPYNDLTSLDTSFNYSLEIIKCTGNDIGTLNVNNNSQLKELWCSYNDLTSMDVTHNLLLKVLKASGNYYTVLNVENNSNLQILWCQYSDLTELDVTQNTALKVLRCSGIELTTSGLDLSGNLGLKELRCGFTGLTVLDVTHNSALMDLRCGFNDLVTLDLSANIFLQQLRCSGNYLTSLDLTSNSDVTYVCCSANELTSLNVTALNQLVYLECDFNELTVLDVSNNPFLTELDCGLNNLSILNFSANNDLIYLYCDFNNLTDIPDVTGCVNLDVYKCQGNYFGSDDCPVIQNIEAMGLTIFEYNPQADDSTLTCP